MEETEGDVANEIPTLRSSTLADGSCPECGGDLWEDDREVICSECSVVVENVPSPRTAEDAWRSFFNDRPEHWNSELPRCVGGFPWPYDWVEREDVDQPIKNIDPDNFYE